MTKESYEKFMRKDTYTFLIGVFLLKIKVVIHP